MKTKILALVLALVMIVGVLPAQVFAVDTTEMTGTSFVQTRPYKTQKTITTMPLTIEAWLKLPSTHTSRGGELFATYGQNYSSSFSFHIHEKGHPRIYLINEGVSTDLTFSNTTVNTGEWVHFAMVLDATNGKIHAYLNGTLSESKDVDTAFLDGIVIEHQVAVGCDLRKGNPYYFKGQIASFAAYSDVRTADEIASDMASPLLDKTDMMVGYDLSVSGRAAYRDVSANENDMSWGGADLLNKDEVEPLDDYAFSFAVIGDTQAQNYSVPEIYDYTYQWVADNVDDMNIQMVMNLGDITEIFAGDEREWESALAAHQKFDGLVPYTIARGNHDAWFEKYFPFVQKEDGSNGSMNGAADYTYQKIEVGSIKYLIIATPFGIKDDGVAWIDEVVTAHPDYNVIFTTHAYLEKDGTHLVETGTTPPSVFINGAKDGDDLWNELVSKHDNIVMVLSGHVASSDIKYRTDLSDTGRSVLQMLIDPQHVDSNQIQAGAVAMYYFSNDGKTLQIRNYCTALDCYLGSESQLDLTVDLIESSGTSDTYNITADESGKITLPDYTPEEAGKLFSGWADENGNIVTASTTFSANEEVTLYAQFIDFDCTDTDCFVDTEGNANDTAPVPTSAKYINGMYLQGAQVRIPLKENKDWGLRFVTVFNTDIKTAIENGGMTFERGTLVVSSLHFDTKNKLTIDTEKATKVNAKNIFASTATLGKNYDKYTACVINIPEEYFDTIITVRPYYTYTDLSGIKHTFYGEQYDCTLFVAASAAYNATNENGGYVEDEEVRESILETIIRKVKGDNDLEIDF